VAARGLVFRSSESVYLRICKFDSDSSSQPRLDLTKAAKSAEEGEVHETTERPQPAPSGRIASINTRLED
jgi:hypothetical protein